MSVTDSERQRAAEVFARNPAMNVVVFPRVVKKPDEVIALPRTWRHPFKRRTVTIPGAYYCVQEEITRADLGGDMRGQQP